MNLAVDVQMGTMALEVLQNANFIMTRQNAGKSSTQMATNNMW